MLGSTDSHSGIITNPTKIILSFKDLWGQLKQRWLFTIYILIDIKGLLGLVQGVKPATRLLLARRKIDDLDGIGENQGPAPSERLDG